MHILCTKSPPVNGGMSVFSRQVTRQLLSFLSLNEQMATRIAVGKVLDLDKSCVLTLLPHSDCAVGHSCNVARTFGLEELTIFDIRNSLEVKSTYSNPNVCAIELDRFVKTHPQFKIQVLIVKLSPRAVDVRRALASILLTIEKSSNHLDLIEHFIFCFGHDISLNFSLKSFRERSATIKSILRGIASHQFLGVSETVGTYFLKQRRFHKYLREILIPINAPTNYQFFCKTVSNNCSPKLRWLVSPHYSVPPEMKKGPMLQYCHSFILNPEYCTKEDTHDASILLGDWPVLDFSKNKVIREIEFHRHDEFTKILLPSRRPPTHPDDADPVLPSSLRKLMIHSRHANASFVLDTLSNGCFSDLRMLSLCVAQIRGSLMARDVPKLTSLSLSHLSYNSMIQFNDPSMRLNDLILHHCEGQVILSHSPIHVTLKGIIHRDSLQVDFSNAQTFHVHVDHADQLSQWNDLFDPNHSDKPIISRSDRHRLEPSTLKLTCSRRCDSLLSCRFELNDTLTSFECHRIALNLNPTDLPVLEQLRISECTVEWKDTFDRLLVLSLKRVTLTSGYLLDAPVLTSLTLDHVRNCHYLRLSHQFIPRLEMFHLVPRSANASSSPDAVGFTKLLMHVQSLTLGRGVDRRFLRSCSLINVSHLKDVDLPSDIWRELLNDHEQPLNWVTARVFIRASQNQGVEHRSKDNSHRSFTLQRLPIMPHIVTLSLSCNSKRAVWKMNQSCLLLRDLTVPIKFWFGKRAHCPQLSVLQFTGAYPFSVIHRFSLPRHVTPEWVYFKSHECVLQPSCSSPARPAWMEKLSGNKLQIPRYRHHNYIISNK